MTKVARLAFLAMVLSLFPVSEAMCGGEVLFLFGSRTLDSDAEPVEDQDVYGVFTFLKKDSWPISFSMGFESSDSGDVDVGGFSLFGIQIGNFQVRGQLTEGYLGVGKVFDKFGSTRPYIGGGFTVIGVQFRAEELATGIEVDDDDTVIAPYLNTGVFWRIGKQFNVGVGLRYVFFADTTLQPSDLLPPQDKNINYLQYNALIGWGW